MTFVCWQKTHDFENWLTPASLELEDASKRVVHLRALESRLLWPPLRFPKRLDQGWSNKKINFQFRGSLQNRWLLQSLERKNNDGHFILKHHFSRTRQQRLYIMRVCSWLLRNYIKGGVNIILSWFPFSCFFFKWHNYSFHILVSQTKIPKWSNFSCQKVKLKNITSRKDKTKVLGLESSCWSSRTTA